MTSPVTRGDVIRLVIWEAVMVPLAVFGPRDWSALAIAWLSFPVLFVLFLGLLIGLRRADSAGTLMVALGPFG